MAEVTINRCIAFFISQPRWTNSVASQSSSSGCDGRSPFVPKSSTVATRPTPKCCAQKRLTATRAVSGLSGATSHLASARRLSGWPAAGFSGGLSTAGTPGVTTSPGLRKLPPVKICDWARRRQFLHHQCRDALFRQLLTQLFQPLGVPTAIAAGSGSSGNTSAIRPLCWGPLICRNGQYCGAISCGIGTRLNARACCSGLFGDFSDCSHSI